MKGVNFGKQGGGGCHVGIWTWHEFVSCWLRITFTDNYIKFFGRVINDIEIGSFSLVRETLVEECIYAFGYVTWSGSDLFYAFSWIKDIVLTPMLVTFLDSEPRIQSHFVCIYHRSPSLYINIS